MKVNKNHIGQLLMVELMAEKNRFRQQIRHYEEKYKQDLNSFKVNLAQEKSENFEAWDDLIEWEANDACFRATIKKLEEVKNGNIELAQ